MCRPLCADRTWITICLPPMLPTLSMFGGFIRQGGQLVAGNAYRHDGSECKSFPLWQGGRATGCRDHGLVRPSGTSRCMYRRYRMTSFHLLRSGDCMGVCAALTSRAIATTVLPSCPLTLYSPLMFQTELLSSNRRAMLTAYRQVHPALVRCLFVAVKPNYTLPLSIDTNGTGSTLLPVPCKFADLAC